MNFLEHIIQYKIVAILRGIDSKHILQVAEALHRGGVVTIEVTLNSPNALQSIQVLANAFENKLLVGAGTVLTAQQAIEAIEAGAKFIISPIVDIPTIQRTKHLGAISIPGAFTATEIVQAYNAGADIIKLFPATVGAHYLKDIKGPLPNIPIMPTGGVDINSIQAFKQAGAVAFGIGSALVKATEEVDETYLNGITEKAQQFVAAIQ